MKTMTCHANAVQPACTLALDDRAFSARAQVVREFGGQGETRVRVHRRCGKGTQHTATSPHHSVSVQRTPGSLALGLWLIIITDMMCMNSICVPVCVRMLCLYYAYCMCALVCTHKRTRIRPAKRETSVFITIKAPQRRRTPNVIPRLRVVRRLRKTQRDTPNKSERLSASAEHPFEFAVRAHLSVFNSLRKFIGGIRLCIAGGMCLSWSWWLHSLVVLSLIAATMCCGRQRLYAA